jgi:ABC-type Fe3+-hydroxamate transport system substrate-binding protein
MKKLFFLLASVSLFLMSACNSNSAKQTSVAASTDTSKGNPVITFDEMVHNFGNVIQGEKVEYSFKFTNTGDKDLLITDASSSCGCTVPDWPKEPLRPGKSAYMKVVFNSAGKDGFTEKEITIKANTNPPVVQGPKIQCTVVKQ